MSINEMKTAIRKLPASEIGELMTWLEHYHEQTWDKQIADHLDSDGFDAFISEAYASGESSLFTKGDIDKARLTVRETIAARSVAK